MHSHPTRQQLTRSSLVAAVALTLCALLLSGCYETTQTTSGAEYLRRYPQPAQMTEAGSADSYSKDLDQRVREVAAIEPILQFPARIGLARIENGRLTIIPPNEADAWKKLRADLGDSFGEFVPLDLLVTELVSGDMPLARGSDFAATTLRNAVAKIRLGGARQHLDAVLIYEVATNQEITNTRSILFDLTLLGTFADTRRSHMLVYAKSLLIDVRNGYPYGSAVASSEADNSTSAFGSEERIRKQRLTVTSDAVAKLTAEVKTSFQQLATKIPRDGVASPATVTQTP